jgi:uncharacterized protein
MSRLLTAVLSALACLVAGRANAAPMTTEPFEFVADGNVLRGVIDLPAGRAPSAVLLFVHGYGRTDVVAQNWYYDLRTRFTDLGVATVVWDKPGCGKSEGSFDIGQPVAGSAREVVAAVRQIRAKSLPGVKTVGLWGISRAGWIAPLAMAEDDGIGFWISVSGTDDQENFPYFVESNLRIEGRSEEQIRLLMGEWRRGFDLTSRGGTFEAYLEATKTLRHDSFMLFLNGSPEPSRTEFLETQRRFRSGEFKVDDESGLMIYVPGFRNLLGRLDVPVLALFGEKDRNVDWRKTRALYTETIGRNPRARLTVKTFPDGNHNLHPSRTGGYREMLEILKSPAISDGYYETMLEWLRTEVLKTRQLAGRRDAWRSSLAREVGQHLQGRGGGALVDGEKRFRQRLGTSPERERAQPEEQRPRVLARHPVREDVLGHRTRAPEARVRLGGQGGRVDAAVVWSAFRRVGLAGRRVGLRLHLLQYTQQFLSRHSA